jgi:hypothetical protein
MSCPRFSLHALALALLGGVGSASAQVLINQAAALAGGVSPGDAPGFPVTLSQGGSYRLTSNLKVPAGVSGVEITASDVRLDLNGHAVIGPNVCTRHAGTKIVNCLLPWNMTQNGVTLSGNGVHRATLHDGSIRGFAGRGVFGGDTLVLRRLHIAHHSMHGVDQGSTAMAGLLGEDLVVEMNQQHGIAANAGLLKRVRVAANGVDGINGSAQLLVQDSLVRENDNFGMVGVSASRTMSAQNGAGNRAAVISMGGNVDGVVPY